MATKKQTKTKKNKKIESKEVRFWNEIDSLKNIFNENLKNKDFYCEIIEQNHSPDKVVSYKIKTVQKIQTNKKDENFEVKEIECNIIAEVEFTTFTISECLSIEGDSSDVKENFRELKFTCENKSIQAKIKVLMSELIEICNNINRSIPPTCDCCNNYIFDDPDVLSLEDDDYYLGYGFCYCRGG